MNVLIVTKIFCLNQQLKSVAHLPWKAFTYKVRPHTHRRITVQKYTLLIFISCQAFNTFIDDVFAFIITMPTSHRLACFRDDVVFLIYLYQRWYTHGQHTLTKNTQRYLLTPRCLHHPSRLYPVDKTRVNEYGVSYDEKPKRKPHKD